MTQFDMFAAPTKAAALPPGFRYGADVIPVAQQDALLRAIEPLPFQAFEFHGFTGKRRVVYFGWRYDFSAERARPTEPIPDFLLDARERAAAFAGLDAERLKQAMVTEYSPGSAIGWHKDKKIFDEVVGVSLAAPCTFRFRREIETGWERRSLTLEPGSAYIITGESRTEWEHSIPPVDALRYSITFRSMR